MKYFGLTGLRALYQTVCFGFIGAVALGSHIFGYPTSEIRDTGGINKTTISSVKEATKTDIPDVAKSFKTTSGASYSVPVNATANTGSKTIYFNSQIFDRARDRGANKSCTDYDAGSDILHCTDYGGRFYYAHRAGAFAQLPSAEVNDYIVLGGQTYQVMKAFPQTNGEIDMRTVINADGENYHIALMTCDGPNDSKRYIVYANRV